MPLFPVRQEKENALNAKMNSLGIHEADLKESFIRSGGKGGQKVNKTSTCVYLKHVPTGIEVKCQKERSRALNRYHARVTLCKKIESRIKGEKSEEAKRIYKIKKQKARRRKKSKEKILESKNLKYKKEKPELGFDLKSDFKDE